MKKLFRIAKPGDIIFITQVTRHRNPIFADEQNVKTLLQTLTEVQCIKKCNIFSFVIMPDHLHLIIRSKISTTNEIMHSLKRNYSLNWKTRCEGSIYTDPVHFWQRRHYEHAIWHSNEFTGYINYIYQNPVKHGYVEQPSDWPYSSFAQNLSQNDSGIHEMEMIM
jgi:putative transposase